MVAVGIYLASALRSLEMSPFYWGQGKRNSCFAGSMYSERNNICIFKGFFAQKTTNTFRLEQEAVITTWHFD